MPNSFDLSTIRHSTMIKLAIGLAVILMAVLLYFLLRPTVLRIAIDKNAGPRYDIVQATATQLVNTHAPLQLAIVPTNSFAESATALDEGKADIAVVQSLTMPTQAQTIAILQRNPIVFIANKDRHITEVAQLHHKKLGVSDTSELNQNVIKKILLQNNLQLTDITLVPIAPEKIAEALAQNKIDVMMTSLPIQGAFLQNLLHDIGKAKKKPPIIFGVEDAEALVQRYPLLESYEIKTGAFGSHPQQPAEDMTTLSFSERLVANANMSNNTASDLTRLIFTIKPTVAHQFPAANSIELLDPDTAIKLDLHPGARAWYGGEQKSFVERYSDVFYLGVSVAGGLISLIGGLISYLSKQRRDQTAVFVNKAEALLLEVRQAHDFEALQAILINSDNLFKDAIEEFGNGQISAEQFAWFSSINQHINIAAQQRSGDLRHSDLKLGR